MSIEYNFDKICRVCCEEGILMSVFKVHISKKLMACASIQVWQNDGLPAKICTKCVAKLHIAFQFRKLCEKSDARLRKCLASKPLAQTQADNIQNNQISPEQLVYTACPGIELASAGQFENVQHTVQTISYEGNEHSYAQTGVHYQTFSLSSGQIIETVAPTDDNQCPEKTEKQPVKHEQDSGVQCQVCNKNIVSAKKLSRHMMIHSGEKPYECKFCLKRFSHSGNYKVHLRMHNDERPYQCTMCSRACRQLQDLEKHMRTHTGEKPHTCPICSRKFTTSSNLVAHKRTHSGEKPYVCPICGKAFCQSNELTKHTRVHTGEKPHECSVCQRRFSGNSSLRIHLRSHTGEKPYVCTICSKAYTQSRCLQAHLKRHESFKDHSTSL
ncbi:hypothetical protein DMENIID0001_138330 [Sergentomyia squamirostris]